MVESVRRSANEFSDELVQGTEDGAFTNEEILEKINNAQRYIYNLIMKRTPEQFLESTDITGVASVYTLPADFGRLVQFRDENGRQVYSLKVKQLKLEASTGNDSYYYKKGNTLVLDKDDITETYKLWYYRKTRNITYGKATAGSALSITLASNASKIVDYYNDMIIENITQDWFDTIDDYSTARVATITETAALNDYYGIISDIPEPFHFLIPMKATIDLKASSPLAMDKIDKTEVFLFQEQLDQTLAAFAPIVEDDVSIEDIFVNYETNIPIGIIID
jgi:hypothetical protein